MSSRTYGPLLDALRGVRWPARRAVGAALPGAHRSVQRGTSGEFTEYRLYRQGDDPRQLDWKLLARSDRAFVRLTDDRAVLPTWFVVDASASMAYPEPDADGDASDTKWSVACALTVGLAAVAHASSDPVGLLAVSRDGPARLSARTRRGTVGELARLLDQQTVGGAAPLTPLLTTIPAMARVVIVSDLLGDADALLRAAAQRTVAGGIVECIHVVAAAELELPSGAFRARDPDTAALERPMDARVRSEYRRRFDAFRADVAQRWRASGAGYVEVQTDASIVRVVRQIAAGSSRDHHGANSDVRA